MTSTPTMTDYGSVCRPSVNETRVASVIERERIFVDLELFGASSMFDVIRELCIGDMS